MAHAETLSDTAVLDAPAPDRSAKSTTHSLVERDASQYTGFSIPFLRAKRRSTGGPPFVRVGRAVRYRIADLDVWLDQHRVDTREAR